jgi:hypothetical protein
MRSKPRTRRILAVISIRRTLSTTENKTSSIAQWPAQKLRKIWETSGTIGENSNQQGKGRDAFMHIQSNARRHGLSDKLVLRGELTAFYDRERHKIRACDRGERELPWKYRDLQAEQPTRTAL